MTKKWKKAIALSLAALTLTGALAGCGDDKKAASGAAKPAAGQTIKINFPTAGASGALYAVGAAITNMWSSQVPGVQASSQASAGGIANLNMVSEGEAQVSIAISSNVYQCLNGTDSFKDHAYKDLKAIGGLFLGIARYLVDDADPNEALKRAIIGAIWGFAIGATAAIIAETAPIIADALANRDIPTFLEQLLTAR